jgi:hypothetical protein
MVKDSINRNLSDSDICDLFHEDLISFMRWQPVLVAFERNMDLVLRILSNYGADESAGLFLHRPSRSFYESKRHVYDEVMGQERILEDIKRLSEDPFFNYLSRLAFLQTFETQKFTTSSDTEEEYIQRVRENIATVRLSRNDDVKCFWQDPYLPYQIITTRDGKRVLNLYWCLGDQAYFVTNSLLERFNVASIEVTGKVGLFSKAGKRYDLFIPTHIKHESQPKVTYMNNRFAELSDNVEFHYLNLNVHRGGLLNVDTPVTETFSQLTASYNEGYIAVEMELSHIQRAISSQRRDIPVTAIYYVVDKPLEDIPITFPYRDIGSSKICNQIVAQRIRDRK